MRPKEGERRRARELRAAGWSLRRISNELDVALSSTSVWVRDIRRPGAKAPGGEPPPAVGHDSDPADLVLRRCGRCKRRRPISEFNRHPRGRQAWCRDCFRDYFRSRRLVHREQVRAATLRRQGEARSILLRHLDSTPCADCGERDPTVLEFDHVRTKRQNISTLVADGVSVEALKAEMAACEVVCVNCHRKRTARRGRWRRARADWRVHGGRARSEERNVLLAYEALARSGCEDCGVRDLCVLDFDHVIPGKTAGVLDLARSGCRESRLLEEILLCAVRCANCHRRRTLEVAGTYRRPTPNL